MKILLTGATGFVGRALCLRLARDGHELHAVVRDVAAARAVLGPDVKLVTWRDAEGLAAMVAACDGVIHLAGEPIVGKRWHAARKEALRHSRLDTAKTIALYAARRATPLQVVVGASAIGYYGDRGDEVLSETSAAGPSDDFAARLCADWEQASRDIPAQRHVVARVGLVLGLGGGLLATMTPTFKLGLGAVLAGGAAWQAWIHLEDLVEIFARAVAEPAFAGVYNATAPNPVTNREFSDALAARYGKRARLGAPRWALRGALGEAAGLVLASTRAVPTALAKQGFAFRFTDVREALADLINPDDGDSGITVGAATGGTGTAQSSYLASTKPDRMLRTTCTLQAPLADVFPFFAAAENLGVITPPAMAFKIVSPLPLDMKEGLLIDYRIKVGPMAMRWRTRIDAWQAGARFVDAQLKGPYAAWHHEHAFTARGAQTEMTDVVRYRVPFGPLGRLAHWLFVGGMLKEIFTYRNLAMRLRFGMQPAIAPRGN